MSLKKIFFIGAGILDAINGKARGGAEIQQAYIIKGLKNKGFEVAIIEYYLDHKIVVDGIHFYPAWNKQQNSFYAKIKSILNIVKKEKPQVIYARGTQLYVAVLFFILRVRSRKIKLLWGVAGDHDLTSEYNYLRVRAAKSYYEKLNSGILFNFYSWLILCFSDVIICQTKKQMKMIQLKFKKAKKTQISNIYQATPNVLIEKISSTYDAIWVGRFTGVKGENILLNIAKDIPKLKILCLGHVSNRFKKEKLFEQISQQKNLILIGRVPSKEVLNYIQCADFILNTSPSEGLSNVFLEGWNLKKPVISYVVNPNEYLTKYEAGFCANNSYTLLIEHLTKIQGDRNYMDYHGKKGREIVIKKHNVNFIIDKYINLLDSI